VLKVINKRRARGLGDKRLNEGYIMVYRRAVPLPVREGLYAFPKKILGVPLEMVRLVHFRTILGFYVEGLNTEIGWSVRGLKTGVKGTQLPSHPSL